MTSKRKLTDEERQEVEQLTEVMLAFRDAHGRDPMMDELKAWWKAYCEGRLRKLIEVLKKTGMPVVFENGVYRILPSGTDLTRN
jgi:hypothetical protein